ncbi:MAG: hypothetical protein ACRD1S_00815 [Vicinamibacterales bacterium]
MRYDRRYGDECTVADAIRSVMREEYRRRLIREGMEAAAAERCVEEFRRTPEFEKRFGSHQVTLSRTAPGRSRRRA